MITIALFSLILLSSNIIIFTCDSWSPSELHTWIAGWHNKLFLSTAQALLNFKPATSCLFINQFISTPIGMGRMDNCVQFTFSLHLRWLSPHHLHSSFGKKGNVSLAELCSDKTFQPQSGPSSELLGTYHTSPLPYFTKGLLISSRRLRGMQLSPCPLQSFDLEHCSCLLSRRKSPRENQVLHFTRLYLNKCVDSIFAGH